MFIIENYLKWKVIEDFGHVASMQLRSMFQEFRNRILMESKGVKAHQMGSSACVDETTALFPQLLAIQLVESEGLFSPSVEEDVCMK